MMTGKDRLRQSVKASLAGLAQVALPLGLGVAAPLLSNLKLSQLGQQALSGQRRARTVSKHLASSMRDCMCLMTPVSPIDSVEQVFDARQVTLKRR